MQVVGGEIDAGGSLPRPNEVDAVHADAQHQIGGTQEFERAARSVAGQGPRVEGVIAREPAARLDLGDDRNVGGDNQPSELFGDCERAGFQAEDSHRLFGFG